MGRLREAIASVRETILSTFVFTGRSRRLDFANYWLASLLLLAVVHYATGRLLAWENQILARAIADIVAAAPMIALFVRRLHDQGRTGWWALILPPLAAQNFYASLRVNFHAFDPQWPELGYWNLPLLLFVLVFIAMLLVPGTAGANRYGPDPRTKEPSIAAG